MQANVNALNTTNYRETTAKALSIISTAFLILTVMAQFITTGTIASIELFVAIPLIIFIGVLAISDIAWAWDDSKILSIAGLVGSIIVFAVYTTIFAVTTGNVLNFSFYLWTVAIVARIVSLFLDTRKLEA